MKTDAPERIWIEEDDCPYFYVESELADAGSPVTEYIRADKLKAEPVVQAKFETVADGIIGTRSVDVKRVEREDDDSLTVVIDYWPTPSPEATALKAENKRLREALEQIEQELNYGHIDMSLRITRRALEGEDDD